MVIVAHTLSAVMQAGSDLENFEVCARELMQNAQLFEELNGQANRLFDVLLIAAVVIDERIERIAQNVEDGTFHRLRDRLIEHDPLAKTASAHREGLDMQIVGERLDDGKRGGHDVRTCGRKPADALAFFHVENADRLIDGTEILHRKLIIVHGVERIFPDKTVDLVEVAEGPAHADHLRIGIDLRKPRNLLELFGEEFFDLCRLLLGRDAVVCEQIGKRHRAERERCIVEHGAAVVIDDLGASAADLQNDPLGDIHRVDDAAIDERRLFLFRQHFHSDPAGCLDLIQK